MSTRPISTLVAVCALSALAVAQQADAPQIPPVFRADVDVIRLDVSVLDKNRRPVSGLAAEAFTVTEDGRPQRVVAVTEISTAENDPVLTARMRYVARDVGANDLVDRLGEGRVFVILLDDFNVPFDDEDIIRSARAAARYVVDGLGPSDVAAVVFTYDTGRTEDFTDDRTKLLAAIDRFQPRERLPGYTERTPQGPGPWGGDVAQRWAPALMRSPCLRAQPAVPALETVALRLNAIPNRRKTVVLVSTGVMLNFGAGGGCDGALAQMMRDAFRIASRGNINIYGVDPGGYRGYEDYLQHPLRSMRMGMATLTPGAAELRARRSREFLMTTAENTGGQAIVRTDNFEAGLDRMFAEDGSYYLVGYQTSNSKPDGRFRKVQVDVKSPGVTVRTRAGYYAAREGSLATADPSRTATTNDLNLAGMGTPQMVALRAAATPVALADAAGGSRDAAVGVVLTVRYPPSAGAIAETLTVTRNLYDAEGRSGPPMQDKLALALGSSGVDGQQKDLFYEMRLAPGRHQLRLQVHSTALGQSGTVYTDVEVPDFTRSRVVVSGVVIGHPVEDPATRRDVLRTLLPIVPTTAREFAPNQSATAFARVYQGGSAELLPMTMRAEILDGRDATVFTTTAVLAPESFGTARHADFLVTIPLAALQRGPHVLSITASPAGATAVRRDVLFRVR